MSLTARQQLFVDEYLKCWNSSEAARRAGYSEKTARFIGAENLTKPNIKAEIETALNESAMSANEALMRLAEQARVSIGEFLTEDGLALNERKVKEKGHLIKSLTPTQYGTKLELHDGQTALLNIGKHHGLFTDKIEVKLAKELELVLKIIESVLDADNYQRVLQAIISRSEGGSEETQADSSG